MGICACGTRTPTARPCTWVGPSPFAVIHLNPVCLPSLPETAPKRCGLSLTRSGRHPLRLPCLALGNPGPPGWEMRRLSLWASRNDRSRMQSPWAAWTSAHLTGANVRFFCCLGLSANPWEYEALSLSPSSPRQTNCSLMLIVPAGLGLKPPGKKLEEGVSKETEVIYRQE